MTNKEILLEGLFDYIKRNKKAYDQEVGSSDKAGGVAGAIGTAAGSLTRVAGAGLKRGIQSIGRKMAGIESTPAAPTPTPVASSAASAKNPNLLATLAAGIAAKKQAAHIASYNQAAAAKAGGVKQQVPVNVRLEKARSMQKQWKEMQNPTTKPKKQSKPKTQTSPQSRPIRSTPKLVH